MANRDTEPGVTKFQSASNNNLNTAEIQKVIALLTELKTDLNGLRTDFRAHDHGASYTANTIRLGASAGTFSGTAEAGTAVAAAVPSYFA